LRDAARRAREETGLTTVALTGGCFANRYLTARLSAALAADGFTVLRHRTIPCNDGGVALGQAVVAAAKVAARGRPSVYTP
jgi:hydrogenase maturation protein HypF